MSYVMVCSNLVQLVALLFLVVGPVTGTLAIRDSINEKVLRSTPLLITRTYMV